MNIVGTEPMIYGHRAEKRASSRSVLLIGIGPTTVSLFYARYNRAASLAGLQSGGRYSCVPII